MADTIETFGTINGVTVALRRRIRTTADTALLHGSPTSGHIFTLSVTKADRTTDIAAAEDHGQPAAGLAQTGKAVIAALAAAAA